MADNRKNVSGNTGGFYQGPGRGPGSLRGPKVKPKDAKGTIRRLWELTAGCRKGLPLILVLSALSCAASVFSPIVIGNAVTAIDHREPVVMILVMLAALYIGSWGIQFLQQFLMASVSQKMVYSIRLSLFEKMKKLPLSFFDRKQHGELMSRLTNDVDNISNTISNSLTQLLTYFFTIVGILAAMLRLSPVLTMISFVSVFFIFLLTRTVTKHTRKLFKEQQAILGRMNGTIEETISGESVVKAFCQEEHMLVTFESYNEEFRKTATRALIWGGFLMPLMNVINNVSYVCISVISGIMAAKGMISVGMITSFLLYVRQFSRPFVSIANIYNEFLSALAGAERIIEILDEKPEPEDARDALPLHRPQGRFELRHVNFGYDSEHSILKDINLTIEPGTKVAVVGATGAGKTTLVSLLTRFYDVDSGEILLDGHDLREYRMADLRASFGVVLQDTALFADTIRSNIAYGRENTPLEDIIAAAKAAGADGFISRLPEGYETVLTQSGMELSQGERQLLTIARAMLVNAPILILDEATSSVDTVTEQRIRRAMLKMSEGRTSFIIAHRLSTIVDSDRILLFEDGKIIEQGNHTELMAIDGQYARMYRTQMGEA